MRDRTADEAWEETWGLAPERAAGGPPDLLGACRALLEALDAGIAVHPSADVIADIRAAVARAEGRA
jgi:hypothetical protein